MKKIHINSLEPSQQQLNTLLEHYKAKRYVDVEKLSLFITEEFPKHLFNSASFNLFKLSFEQSIVVFLFIGEGSLSFVSFVLDSH